MTTKRATIYCWVIAMIWGMGFVATDIALNDLSCFVVLFIRFAGSSLLSWILVMKKSITITTKTILRGVINGVLLFIAYALQTYSLTLTDVGNNAFISASGVVIVPYLCYFIFKKKPVFKQMLGSISCLFGIGIISMSNFTPGKGDLLALCCAFFFASHLVSLQYTCHYEDSCMINAVQLSVCALLSLPGALLNKFPQTSISIETVLSCIYIVVFATFACFYLQTQAQQTMNASQCSAILSTECVFAAIFSVIFLKEPLSFKLIVGGIIVLVSVIMVQTATDS